MQTTSFENKISRFIFLKDINEYFDLGVTQSGGFLEDSARLYKVKTRNM